MKPAERVSIEDLDAFVVGLVQEGGGGDAWDSGGVDLAPSYYASLTQRNRELLLHLRRGGDGDAQGAGPSALVHSGNDTEWQRRGSSQQAGAKPGKGGNKGGSNGA